MPEVAELKIFALVGFLVAAVIVDVRLHRISNRLCAFTIVTGLLLQVIVHGTDGLLAGVAGFLTGLAILLPFYLSGGMGAGDVKLLASVGTFLGVSGALIAGIVTVCVGALIGGGIVTWNQFRDWGAEQGLPGFRSSVTGNYWQLEFPYAAAIAVGAVTALFVDAPLRQFIN